MTNMQAYLDDFGKITVMMNRGFYNGKSDSFYSSIVLMIKSLM